MKNTKKFFSLLLLLSLTWSFTSALASEDLDLSNSNSTTWNGTYNNVEMYNSTYTWNQTIEWDWQYNNSTVNWNVMANWDLDLSNTHIVWNVIAKWDVNFYNSTISGSLLVYWTLNVNNTSEISGNIYVYWWKIEWYNLTANEVQKEVDLGADFSNAWISKSKVKVLWSMEWYNSKFESVYLFLDWSKKTFNNTDVINQYSWYFAKVDPLLEINLEEAKRQNIKNEIAGIEGKVANLKGLISKEVMNHNNAVRLKKTYDLATLNWYKQEIFNLKKDLVWDKDINDNINNLAFDLDAFEKVKNSEMNDTVKYLNSIIGNKFDVNSVTTTSSTTTSSTSSSTWTTVVNSNGITTSDWVVVNSNWIYTNWTIVNSNWIYTSEVSIDHNGITHQNGNHDKMKNNEVKSSDLPESVKAMLEKKLSTMQAKEQKE